jgi:hypothetical protein
MPPGQGLTVDVRVDVRVTACLDPNIAKQTHDERRVEMAAGLRCSRRFVWLIECVARI